MGLLTPGYLPYTYWPAGYFIDDYWPDYVPTPYPLNVTISQSLEYGITISQSLEYGITISQSLEYGITISQSGGAS